MTVQSKVIIVAEDEQLTRMLAVELLTEAGYSVIEARHAAEAMDLLEEHYIVVRLLFTDIHMPGAFNGLELAHRVKARWPHIATVLASGVMRPLQNELPDGGIFVRKPYQMEHVVGHVNALTA